MPGYQDPFMGGPPQMGPQGQQGPPMGGGMPPMGGQQGPQQPRQGPPQQGPGGGGAPGGPPMDFQTASSPLMRGQNLWGAKDKYQSAIDDLMLQLQFAQMQGKNPMVIADLQMQLQQAQRGMGEWQNQMYGEQMAKYSQPGPRGVGQNAPAPPGQSQLQKNPFLEMLLMGQLGMGGGPAGGRGGQQIG